MYRHPVLKPEVWVLLAWLLLPWRGVADSGTEILPGFQSDERFQEQVFTSTNIPGVRFHINAPRPLTTNKPVKLVIYGLPNGNTIEQTIGKRLKPDDDWHYDIQHIGAQTRFLRRKLTNEQIVVAYLENSLKSWPSWRKQHGDRNIPGIMAKVQQHFTAYKPRLILTGHSGGGSFTFGYLNTVEKIPESVVRMAFLDSNYAYDSAAHKSKLVEWLRSSDPHFLVILAYRDHVALLNGKTFVSAAGGTWGRSELMKADLAETFEFADISRDEWQNSSALNGRIKFFLRENPEKKIWHTVQVERNGFIHAMLAGTAHENVGYQYFGDRAYSDLIDPE